MASYALDQWYVAGWSGEVTRTPLARTICGIPVVLYRREDGTATALEDACPHRLLPLSMGTVEGNSIRCRYHALLLDAGGRCLEMPGGLPANPAVCAPAYAVAERYGLVWVWIGEAGRADPALLPDLWMNEHPDWRVSGGTYHVKCDYRLLIDNLMDLTHEATVHASSIGQKELHEFPIETKTLADRVVTSRWMDGVPPSPLYRALMGDYDGLVDRWQISMFLPPASVIIDVGVARVDRGMSRESHEGADVRSFVLNFVTPEDEGTCHYFWGSARTFQQDDDAAFDRFTAIQGGVFMEDVEVLEAQQAMIDRLPGRRLNAYSIDSGGVRARTMLDKLIG